MNTKPKNPHAVALGRLGGRPKGTKGQPLTSDQARAMANARWTKTPIKLCKAHILAEDVDEDGCWITLKCGWRSASDPVGNLHTIHEDTSAKAWAEKVLRCDCQDCRKEIIGIRSFKSKKVYFEKDWAKSSNNTPSQTSNNETTTTQENKPQ